MPDGSFKRDAPLAWSVLSAAMLVATVFADVRTAGYAREAVAAGSLWRLVSSSFVHLSPMHLAMNVAALGAMLAIWGPLLGVRALAVVFALATTAHMTAVHLAGHLAWGAGASGALHALAAYAAATLVLVGPRRRRRFGWLCGAGLAGKLLVEASLPPLFTSAAFPVAFELHRWGAACGVAMAAAAGIRRRLRQPVSEAARRQSR